MTNEDLISGALKLLLEANQLLKTQASERQSLFTKMIDTVSGKHDAIDGLNQIEQKLDPEETSPFFKQKKLDHLNKRIDELDHKYEQRDQILRELEQFDTNLSSRNELVKILREYCEMEEASIYKMVSDYNEDQENLEEIKREGQLLKKLSTNDPRMKALEILRSRSNGMSITQLSFLLGTSQYQASKIIAELIDMDLIIKQHNLLKFTPPVQIEETELLVH